MSSGCLVSLGAKNMDIKLFKRGMLSKDLGASSVTPKKLARDFATAVRFLSVI